MNWKYFEAFQEPRNNQQIYVEVNGNVLAAVYRKAKDKNGLPYGVCIDSATGVVISPLPEKWATKNVS